MGAFLFVWCVAVGLGVAFWLWIGSLIRQATR